MKTKDKSESAKAKRLVGSKPKQCYINAARVVLHFPEYANADYVEGLAVVGGVMVIEHGWVEKDGMIVDPTLPHDNLDYFPGLRFRGQRGLAEAMRIPKPRMTNEDFPIFYRFGWGGVDSPEFREALIAAYRHVGMEDLAKRYEDYRPEFLPDTPFPPKRPPSRDWRSHFVRHPATDISLSALPQPGRRDTVQWHKWEGRTFPSAE